MWQRGWKIQWMPDSRFEAAYARVAAARRAPRGLRKARRDDLVAALAVAGTRDPPFANALATELLNRMRRAPYLGAAISLAACFLALVITNWIDVGRPVFLETGPRAELLDGLALLLGVSAILALLVYRGHLAGLRARLTGQRHW